MSITLYIVIVKLLHMYVHIKVHTMYMIITDRDTISGEASTHFCVSTVQQASSVSCVVGVTSNVLYNLGNITLCTIMYKEIYINK